MGCAARQCDDSLLRAHLGNFGLGRDAVKKVDLEQIIHTYTCLFVHARRSTHARTHTSIRPSVHPSVRPSIHPSMHACRAPIMGIVSKVGYLSGGQKARLSLATSTWWMPSAPICAMILVATTIPTARTITTMCHEHAVL